MESNMNQPLIFSRIYTENEFLQWKEKELNRLKKDHNYDSVEDLKELTYEDCELIMQSKLSYLFGKELYTNLMFKLGYKLGPLLSRFVKVDEKEPEYQIRPELKIAVKKTLDDYTHYCKVRNIEKTCESWEQWVKDSKKVNLI